MLPPAIKSGRGSPPGVSHACEVIFLCIKTRVLKREKHEINGSLWEQEMGTGAAGKVFQQFVQVLANFYKCLCNLIDTPRKCFLLLLENAARERKGSQPFILIKFSHPCSQQYVHVCYEE